MTTKSKVMKKGYWNRWNDDVQAQIDENIEKYRKADGSFKIKGLKAGTTVKAEQIKHDFIFGAHIFNYDQLGTDERNEKYKALYGDIFNSATVAFYWRKFELEEGKPRFEQEFRDTAEYWNTVKDPKNEPHWRRPATDPVIDFCEKKGIRIHGHPLVWGNYKWMQPDWLFSKYPKQFRDRLPADAPFVNRNPMADIVEEFTAEQIHKLMPDLAVELQVLMAKRIAEIAFRYGDRVHSWDVCNESASDFQMGNMIPDAPICKSHYGPMPGDYTYRAFKLAESMLPRKAMLNINDYNLSQYYVDQIADLDKRGCKIDIVGAQMHLFNPQTCIDIADGKSDVQSPAGVIETMDRLSKAGRPIHLSEITITAPNNDARGQEIQEIITRNLYRLWFSTEKMMGITWWNVVDDCGAPGEPSVSGLFSRDMDPKPAYHALEDLIKNQWMTKCSVKASAGGTVKFRGFRGTYRLSWKAEDGSKQEQIVHLA